MELLLQKLPSGVLAPVREEDVAMLQKVRSGATIRCKASQMRNGRFFRKWWVLAKYAYDLWEETVPTIEHRGERVQPNFERFRKDLTILAGHYHPVFNIRGEMRVEADSLRWDRMSEQEFDQLYSHTIQTILNKVLARNDLTEQDLRTYVERVLSFD